MAIADILSALITKEGTLTGNPVAPFAYSSTAFARDDADGHPDYNVARENNIPTADPDVLDVNGTVLAKGFRSQASSLTRMLMNHFFGRASYNLNKTVEVMNSLLAGLSSALGANNGIATLDSSGKLSSSQIPGEIVTSVNGVNASNNTVDITGEDINISSSSSTKVNTALATLQSNIEAEATARRSTDTALQSDIDDLETADQTLQTNIDTVSANLASEVTKITSCFHNYSATFKLDEYTSKSGNWYTFRIPFSSSMPSANYAVIGTVYMKQVITENTTEVASSFVDSVWQIQSLGYYTSSKNKNYIDIAMYFSGDKLNFSASEVAFNLTCIDNY